MNEADSTESQSPSGLIDRRIAELGGWRGESLSRMRKLIREADPDVVEEWKWAKATSPGTPVWSHDGIICTGESYRSVVKLTFARGAELEDPASVFNSSLDGNVRRAIDIHEGEEVDAGAFKTLVHAAVLLNTSGRRVRPGPADARAPDAHVAEPTVASARKPALLAGGNPQIAKADGDAPVQAYIAALPGWKRGVGGRIDALVTCNVPTVRKGVRWNSPFYGVEGEGWFLGLHAFTRYLKVTFFRGTSLRPVPPGGTDKDARWIDVHEDDFDEAQMTAWIRQAAALPGWGKA